MSFYSKIINSCGLFTRRTLIMILVISGLNIIYSRNTIPLSDTQSSSTATNSSISSSAAAGQLYKVKFQKQSGIFIYGYINLSNNLLSQLEYTGNYTNFRSITTDMIKSIRIRGYTNYKETNQNLSRVYYFPLRFDITLKDGRIITGIQGRIPEIEEFTLFNSFREISINFFEQYILPTITNPNDRAIITRYYAKSQADDTYKLSGLLDPADERKIRDIFFKYNIGNKFFTFFVRYWLEDTRVFTDNQSNNYNAAPPVNQDTVIYIEFE